MRASRVVQNFGGGVLAQNGAELVLRNCFVGGSIDTDVVAILDSDATVIYTTLGASLGETSAVTCSGTATVNVRNSLIVSRSSNPELACPDATVSYSVTEASTEGEGNIVVGDVETSWFADYNSGDFHLTTAPVAIGTTAVWQPGDPPTDIDGNARPQTEGVSDFAGADVP